jgi:hypothetical protein
MLKDQRKSKFHEWDEIARSNSEALKFLPAGKFLIDIPQNGIPLKLFEKGMPIRRSDKPMALCKRGRSNEGTGKIQILSFHNTPFWPWIPNRV